MSATNRRRAERLQRKKQNEDFLWCPIENLAPAKELIEVAKIDSDSACVLYEHQLYAPSIFHLQQAFEKLIKAEMYLCGYFTRGEIKDCNHDVLRATLELKNQMADHYDWGDEPGTGPLFDLVKKNRNNVERLDYDVISKLLAGLPPKDDIWSAELKSYGIDQNRIKESYSAIYETNILAALLAYHEQSTRYCDAKDSALNPFDYSPKLGIVKAIPLIRDDLEHIIAYLQSLIGHISRSQNKEK